MRVNIYMRQGYGGERCEITGAYLRTYHGKNLALRDVSPLHNVVGHKNRSHSLQHTQTQIELKIHTTTGIITVYSQQTITTTHKRDIFLTVCDS